MQNRPDVSLLKNTYLETYKSIKSCLMHHNFSLLLSRNVERQVFDIVITAQKQKVPTKKLECNKDLNKFCNNLIYEYNKGVSVVQQMIEGVFIYSLLMFFFSLLDVVVGKVVAVNTIVICSLIFIGYFTASMVLRRKKEYDPKLRSLLVLVLIFIPFMLMSYLKSQVGILTMVIPLTYSLLILLITFIVAAISYYILIKKYDLFLFIKGK
ncbi:hypothetical protein [Clostridium chromiireducens]|uniref:DUF1129 family protein n=1 Tax=Clostridium chromiireducens TaxID=225345 RepID=A0A1V4IFE7_9CLOT|nr:hypothetical protein [Clostridium chromiireducens]OPJ58574.1 hypothetical protein CLCHR_38240 [Clostridium chromiireducens]RII35313.1 hypothetical protein D2A34_08890 [Clostridium chromiireducens]